MSCFTCKFLFILLITATAVTGPTLVYGDNTEMAHIHLYMHDKLSAPNATAVIVLNGSKPVPNAPGLNFGDTIVIDDLLTEAPSTNSTPVGRGQGFYSSVALDKAVFMLVMNVVLTSGEYNGSSISIMGSDDVSLTVRELSVIGGTGQFRMARGYVTIKTFSLNFTNVDAVLEMDIYATKAKKAN